MVKDCVPTAAGEDSTPGQEIKSYMSHQPKKKAMYVSFGKTHIVSFKRLPGRNILSVAASMKLRGENCYSGLRMDFQENS